MTIRYLLIDDEPSAESFGAALESASHKLKVEVVNEREPRDIEALIKRTKPDGLLMDLQLTRYKGKADEFFPMDGPGLAQELRTKSNSEGSLRIPIVSLSFDQRRVAVIGHDSTPNDLFDIYISKSAISGHAENLAANLMNLSEGYGEIREAWRHAPSEGTLARILGVSREDLRRIDSRSLNDLQILAQKPIHNVAVFLLHSFLGFSGPLIDEATLATRLGIDLRRSPGAWKTIKEKLPKRTQYAGVFSGIHKRWWMWGIADWWQKIKEVPVPLSMLVADERVSFLKAALNITRVSAIAETTRSPGARFWHVCQRTGFPVDPAEGYMIADHPLMRPWHDKRYLCRGAALRGVRDYVFEPGEKERLRKFGRRH